MPSILVRKQSEAYVQSRPEVRTGYTVRVHEKITEGDKERVQIFEGLVIAVHKGVAPTDSTITVRKVASGIGVEKVFSLHSPKIEQIEMKKIAKVRRSKLFFLRGRRGKAARLSERFTNAGEFDAAVAPEAEEEEIEVIEEIEGKEESEASEQASVTESTEEATAEREEVEEAKDVEEIEDKQEEKGEKKA
jgi:large subunit ribosomal protein L19